MLVPGRADLGQALRRVIEAGWRFTGASDHLVSEALYLNDPEGNGIEIYRDRPRDEWPRNDEGVIQMATLPLDIDGVLGEVDGAQPVPELMPAGTHIGHIHLQVANLRDAETFYSGALGFDGDGADLSGRAVRGGRRIPPPHRTQHLGERRRLAAAARARLACSPSRSCCRAAKTPSAWPIRRARRAPRSRRATAQQ